MVYTTKNAGKGLKVQNSTGGEKKHNETNKRENQLIWRYMDAIGKFLGDNWKPLAVFLIIIFVMFVPAMSSTNLTVKTTEERVDLISVSPNRMPLFSYFLLREYKVPIGEGSIELKITFFDSNNKEKFEINYLIEPDKTITYFIPESFNTGERIIAYAEGYQGSEVIFNGGKKMSEKVLGFYKKDAWKRHPENTDFCIEEKDFVPVVSVEWLEKYCKKNKGLACYDCVLEQKVGHKDNPKDFVSVDDLLVAVRKEARKK